MISHRAGENKVISKYATTNNVITIVDKEGYSCDKPGEYIIDNDDYYLSIDLLKDDCDGRIITTIGYWTRSNFKELISNLDSLINISPNNKDYYLSRARINMAIGRPNLAISDLDKYILIDSSNGEAFLSPGYTVGILLQEPPLDETKNVLENAVFLYMLKPVQI